ncbi:DNA-directed RNA polymerase subunit alpha [Patescibacteria group bacterium]|nr:DNA-directed RNA polymerase subunit alpha [Patescibacteria group bacterium]
MVPLPLQPKIIEKKGNKAIFQIEGLYPGYGVTIGNSLRRVLLSSLPGAAVTRMKITGIQHEFSTIPGVLEDVIEIILNLKQLRFKLFTSESQKARLKVKGEREVKASDFELPSQVEIVNKTAHIATLTSKKAELEMEIQIEKGLGYQPRESRENEKLEIGEISLDAIFTPVKRISYKIENMRVGKRTDFDRLNLEVETDGQLTPEEAFSQASEILVKHFSLFSESFKKEEALTTRAVAKGGKEDKSSLTKTPPVKGREEAVVKSKARKKPAKKQISKKKKT